MFTHMHAHARILFYFLNSTLSIHPYATTSPHVHITITLSHPRTVALLAKMPAATAAPRRPPPSAHKYIYYTPTLDSVIVAIALPAATAAPPSSRQPTRTCWHRVRTGRSHSQVAAANRIRSSILHFYRRANRERFSYYYKFHLHPTFEVRQRGSYFSLLIFFGAA